MNQDSTEPQASDRPAPGESIAKRLFSRGSTRASVGPRADFYHRLGVPDPYAFGDADEATEEGAFTFLSSAAYFRDLRRSRLGLLSRISSGPGARVQRLEERLRRIGPAAANIRPSTLASLGLMTDDFTVLAEEPDEVEEEEEEARIRTVSRPNRRRLTPQIKERVVYRPLEQAMARDGGTADDDLTKVFERVLAGFRGRDRRELRAILEEVASQPASRRVDTARRAVRRLGGPARAIVQAETAQAVDDTGERPVQVAASRGATHRRQRGLRRVLGASPAVLVLEQPAEPAEEVAEAPQARPTRRPAAPRAARRPVVSRAREAARSQQVSGRAGPSAPEAVASTPAAPRRSRRPMEEMAARVLRVAATPEHARGLDPSSSPRVRRVYEVVRRAEAGELRHEAAPIARAATGYIRRSRPKALDPVFAVLEGDEFAAESADEMAVPTAAPQRAPAVRSASRARPQAPTSRLVEQAAAVALTRQQAPAMLAPQRGLSLTPTAASAVSETLARRVRARATAGVVQLVSMGPEDAPDSVSSPSPAGRRVRRRGAESPAAYRAERAPLSRSVAGYVRSYRKVRVPEMVVPEVIDAAEEDLAVEIPASARPLARVRATAPAARRLASSPVAQTRAVVVPSLWRDAPVATSEGAPAAVASARRRPSRAVAARRSSEERLGEAPAVVTPLARSRRSVLRAHEVEAPTYRAARRARSGERPVRARRRSALPMVATSYLTVEPEDLLGEEAAPAVAGVARRPVARAAERADAPVPERVAPMATDASPSAPGGEPARTEASVVSRVTSRAVAPSLGDEAPAVRAARRVAAAAPVQRKARSVLPMATAYLATEQADDDVAAEELSAPAAVPPRSRPAPVAALSADDTTEAPETVSARVQARARRVSTAEASTDAPSVRAARRAVVPTAVRASRAVLTAAPTAYLAAAPDEVADEVAASAPASKPRPSVRAALRDEPVATASRTERVSLAASPVAYVEVASDAPGLAASPVARSVARAEVPTVGQSVMERAERAAEGVVAARPSVRSMAPEQVLAQGDEALDDSDAPEAAGTARPTERAARRADDTVATRPGRRDDDVSSTPSESSSVAERVASRGEVPVAPVGAAASRDGEAAPVTRRRTAVRAPESVLPVGDEQEAAPAEGPVATGTIRAPRRPRATAQVAARAKQAGRRSFSPVEGSVRPRRRAGLVPHVGATALAAMRAVEPPRPLSVAPKPMRRFRWDEVVAELASLSEEGRAEAWEALARRGEPRASRSSLSAFDAVFAEAPEAVADDAATAPVAGGATPRRPLALREVARRTRQAVRALQRDEASVLTFDASRRTFGDAPGREHTVEARVERDAEGRVHRVVAKRLATGEQVLLVGDEAEEILEQAGVEAAPVRGRRPSQTAWVEERVTVGRAGARSGEEPVREAPGARLVERAAAPEGGLSRPLRRAAMPATVLAQAPAEGEGDASLPAVARRARPRRPSVALGPVTLAAAQLPAVVDERSELGSTPGRRSPALPMAARSLVREDEVETTAEAGAPVARRSLRQSMAAVSAQRSTTSSARRADRTAARRVRRGRSADVPARDTQRAMPAPSFAEPWSADETGLEANDEAPAWVRRANEGTSVPVRSEVPDAFLRPRVRTGGGLLTALARAGDAEEVVRVILERSNDLREASVLPVAAQRLMHRMADEAGQVAAVARGERAQRRGTTVPTSMVETVRRDVLQPVTVAASGPRSTATTTQGVGASKVMKLANKLMKLIHLAESEGRGDAHRHVRMSEDTADSRAEGGAGATTDQFDEKTMNIKALRQDVLSAVLKALEDMRWRREDPDGPSIWC